jgi:hypothetical protein
MKFIILLFIVLVSGCEFQEERTLTINVPFTIYTPLFERPVMIRLFSDFSSEIKDHVEIKMMVTNTTWDDMIQVPRKKWNIFLDFCFKDITTIVGVQAFVVVTCLNRDRVCILRRKTNHDFVYDIPEPEKNNNLYIIIGVILILSLCLCICVVCCYRRRQVTLITSVEVSI